MSLAIDSTDGCFVANAFNTTQHNYISSDQMRNKAVRYDDSNSRGKYHTIDTREWEEIECHVINKNLIGVGREHGLKDATVYIQIREEGRTDKCDNYLLFNTKDFIEYRRERGENKYQEPMISKNGVIWVGNTNGIYNFRTFILKRKGE